MSAAADRSQEVRRARAAARLAAVQAIFQMEQSGQSVAAVQTEFEDHRLGVGWGEGALAEADSGIFRGAIAAAVDRQREIDRLADRALAAAWPIDRIDPTLRALFRAAGAELVTGEAPPRVIVTEYLDIAHAFFPGGREPAFVNGVLDHMAHAARPEAF